MEDKSLLNEYVLNDSGYIYQGSGTSQVLTKPWNYGQVSQMPLISIYLSIYLSKSFLSFFLSFFLSQSVPI